MNTIRESMLIAVSLALLLAASQVRADTEAAHCKFRKRGETSDSKTGPCTFSQRQGFVSIVLRNGDRIELRPGKSANRYKDEDGNKVERSIGRKGEHVYEWEHKRIIVTFDDHRHENRDRDSH